MIEFIFFIINQLQLRINRFMRENKKQQPIDIKALFKNTKSKFYSKKKSVEKEEKFQEKNSSANTSGAYWKNKGNQHFKNKEYDAAITCYSKAIEINPGESQYYSNRSKCYQKKHMFQEALLDAEVACQLNEGNIKAHYICGCILAQLGKHDQSKLKKSENRLKKALRLCTTLSAPEFQQQISIRIFRLRKIIFLKEQETQYQSLKKQKELIKNAFDKYQMTKKQYDLILNGFQKRENILKSPKEIPDHLICKITLMLIEDPVVSEAGFSYERKALEEYYQAKGPMEPITRKQTKGKIFPNHSLRIAIELFLNENPWAYEQEPNEQYQKIVMI